MSQIRAAGLDAVWDVRETSSRNQLLKWIDRDACSSPKLQSVALIDHRSESGDLEQLGFRIVESIRRHAYLWKATRPVIWVDHLSGEHEGYARSVAADAVLDDAWVDRDPGTALAQVVEWCRSRPVAPYPSGSPRVFTEAAATVDQEIERRDARFRRSFGFAPDELDYMMLWGMAGAVELQFLDRHCAELGYAVSERAARKARENLQRAMRAEREELDRAEPTNAELARWFLADALAGAPDPLAYLSWPTFSQIRDLRRRPPVLRAAFLEPGAEAVLDRFFAALSAAETSRSTGSTGASNSSRRLELIEEVLSAVAGDLGVPFLRVHGLVHRSCHALSDAYDDWRRVGDAA